MNKSIATSASGYLIYHDSFSEAMTHAYSHARIMGCYILEDEVWDKVTTSHRKPSVGETNSYHLKAVCNASVQMTAHIQVYNMGRSYELNMYMLKS